MNNDRFEALQRSREWFHGLRLLPGFWAVVRVDGGLGRDFGAAWATLGSVQAVNREAGVGLRRDCSAAYTHACGELAHFDSRVRLGTSIDDVVDYSSWPIRRRPLRPQRLVLLDWTLRSDGMSAKQATAALNVTTRADKNELLFGRGVNSTSSRCGSDGASASGGRR